MSKTIKDLSVTMRGDVNLDNLPDYVAAFGESIKGDLRVSYGRTVVYMAARDLTPEFEGAKFAKEVGVSPAYVSTLAGLALAVDKSITPHGNAKMSERWAALVQNMTKDVRAALRKGTLADLDKVLFSTASAKADKKSEDAKAARAKAAADKKSGDDVSDSVTTEPLTVESAITALDQAAAFLALSKDTPAQRERIESIVSTLSAHVAA